MKQQKSTKFSSAPMTSAMSGVQARGGEALHHLASSKNYIQECVVKVKKIASPVVNQISIQTPTIRFALIAILATILFWPLLFVLFALPWVLFLVLGIYAIRFGPTKLLNDFSSTIEYEFGLDVGAVVNALRAKIHPNVKATLLSVWEAITFSYKYCLLSLMNLVDSCMIMLLKFSRACNQLASKNACAKNGHSEQDCRSGSCQ